MKLPTSIPIKVSEEVKAQFKGMTSKESIDFQLSEWVKGYSIHNPVRDECCPDFSCCSGVKIMEESLRIKLSDAYKIGDEKTLMAILGMALAELVLAKDLKIHVVGENTTIN